MFREMLSAGMYDSASDYDTLLILAREEAEEEAAYEAYVEEERRKYFDKEYEKYSEEFRKRYYVQGET